MAARHDLTYALRRDRLVSIDKVGRGLQPDCICPACHEPLIAKKGDIKSHHFAHASGEGCEESVETALHQLAKHIICSPGATLGLPVYEIRRRVSVRREWQILRETVIGVGGKPVRSRCGSTEVRFEGFTADAVIEITSSDGRKVKRLIVEVAVTHASGKEKIRRMAAEGVPAIEIDMTRFPLKCGLSEDSIRQALLEARRVRWLYHPNEQHARARLATRIWQIRSYDPLAGATSKNSEHKPGMQGLASKSHWAGFDNFVAEYESRHGLVTLDVFRSLQNRYFGSERRPHWQNNRRAAPSPMKAEP